MTTDESTKLTKHIERAVIQDSLKDKLAKLRDQANAAMQGIATVTKSDIVNLVLAKHADTLNSVEIEELRAQHLDQVKFAFWVAKRLKEAQAAGENLSLQDVLAMTEPIAAQPVAKKPRRPRKKREPQDELPLIPDILPE